MHRCRPVRRIQPVKPGLTVRLNTMTLKPGGRLWGYAFGDLYYLQHADATNRGGETNYAGVPANRNAFSVPPYLLRI